MPTRSPSVTYPPLPSPEEMVLWDHAAIHDFGIHEAILMENASREALHVLLAEYGEVTEKHILLFMGNGNNGGDAAALARHLHDQNARVLVLHTRPLGKYSGVTGYHLRIARKAGVPFKLITPRTLETLPTESDMPDIIVDGLLGTGFQGILREATQVLIEWINSRKSHSFVYALDVPSGLDAQRGTPSPVAVSAHATVTFEAAKVGLCMPEANAFTGTLHVRPIGIPKAVREKHPSACVLLNSTIASLLPATTPDMHKGTSGHVVVLGGAPGMTGAPMLAALGAIRGGAGYVTIAAPEGLLPLMTHGHPEVMTVSTGTGCNWDVTLPEHLEQAMARASVMVVGPGMGRDDAARDVLRSILSHDKRPPLILDADALYHLATSSDRGVSGLLPLLRPGDVLTPHPGEMARLAGTDTTTVQKERLATARHFALEYPCVLVLKGAGTVIAHKGAPLALSPFSTPPLAVAGSGDVLAGLIGSLLAQGLTSRDAACLAVYLHGLAGKTLQTDFPSRGNSALDIINALISAKKELISCLPPKI